MPNRYRALLWTVASAHLVAAGATWLAGVPVASPFVLALAAVVVFMLGFARSPHTDDGRGHPLLGRVADGRSSTDSVADDELAARSAPE